MVLLSGVKLDGCDVQFQVFKHKMQNFIVQTGIGAVWTPFIVFSCTGHIQRGPHVVRAEVGNTHVTVGMHSYSET